MNPLATIGLVAMGSVAAAVLTILLAVTTRSSLAGDIPLFVIDALVGGSVLAAMGQALLGRKISISDAVKLSQLGWILVTGVIYWLVILIVWIVPLLLLHGWGILISLPLGTWLGIMLSLTFPIVVLERKNSIAAITRSWQLVTGSFWRFFGIFALLGVVMFVIFFFLGIILSLVGVAGIFAATAAHAGAVAIGALIGAAVIYLVMGSIVVSIWTGVILLLYADTRMRKEGMDLILQQAAQNQQLTGDEFATYAPPANASVGQGGGGGGYGGGSGYSGGGYAGGSDPSAGGYQGGGGAAGGYPGAPSGY